ncbi:unnamed protein product [Oikopleura dioica]|uniref:Uncharacterized protein n=1 Tax=Oikopleura dioica TaxID=34765 RepID=E4YQR4_OIKDI|nr:unnamed protein product [Oikopleura dioica]
MRTRTRKFFNDAHAHARARVKNKNARARTCVNFHIVSTEVSHGYAPCSKTALSLPGM